jgi:hypothetical protein
MIRLICLWIIILPLASQAQFTYFLDQSIPVQDFNGGDLRMPWAGGLNAAQFNTMDLNGDGSEDLVLFDRMANKVITFVNSDNQYVPAPDFEGLFPAQITNWLLLRDYNCDGLKDIFTGHSLGIKVFKNVSSSANLAWEHHLFKHGIPDPEFNVLMTLGSTTHVNLQLQSDDLPSISDVDGDGDLDILNIQYQGHSVEFHQNMSMENSRPCDSLDFRRVTRSWGNFRECQCGVFAFNGEDCPPSTGGRTKHAGGKSLLALDFNGDQQQDLLFSEAECTQLFGLRNDGTSLSPVINSFSTFPQATPVNFVLSPAAFYEDVDFDGKKDLISSPNIFTREFINVDLEESVWFYKNTGTATHPSFSFVEPDFLQRHMIDVGDNAVPAFADHDGDGDLDLFVSRNTSNEYTSTVFLYENIGSASDPFFKLISEDYLGFSTARFYNLRIQFNDINSDQTTDLVFSATSFEDASTRLYYLNNQSQASLDFSGGSLRRVEFPLTSSENAYVTDVNGDGLPDILAGRSEGNLEYWKNNGAAGTPAFILEDESYLGFNGSGLGQNISCVAADLDGDGNTDLIVGDQSGKIGVISDFRDTLSNEMLPQYNIVFNSALQAYSDKNLGGKIWPTVANLFNSNRPTIVVGNVLGGIHILTHDEGKALPEEPEVNVYPNPISDDEVLHIQADRTGVVQIISVLGQQLSPAVMLNANEVYRYAIPPLASGLYLVHFTVKNKSHTVRFVIK